MSARRRLTALFVSLTMALTLIPAIGASADAHITPIYDIQGAGHQSPVAGQTVVTTGIVTAVRFGGAFFVQDPVGDGDSATSDGIEVSQPRGDSVAVGDLVEITGRPSEFIPGGASTGNLSLTNFFRPTVTVLSSGNALPEPVVIGRGGRVPPNEVVISDDELPVNLQFDAGLYDPDSDAIDFYESLEGMLVHINKPVAVSGIRQFGNFSAELWVLADNGKDVAPRDARTQRGGIELQPDPDNRGDQNPERIQIQLDGTIFGTNNYPGVEVGDKLRDISGVVGYSFGNFEVNAFPVENGLVKAPGALTPENAPVRAGRLSVASYNVLNLSATSSDDAQRALVAEQIVDNLRSPDVIALQEIQDNNGTTPCPDGEFPECLNADLTLQLLVDDIVAAGGPTYEFIDVPPLEETTQTPADGPDVFGGAPFGNIRNAFLYNPDRVDLVGYTGLTRDVLAARGVSVNTAFDFSRDPLEAVFEFNGEEIVVINNHFSSRFGSSPIFGGPQPFVQAAEDAREAQSLAMNEVTEWWLDQDDDKHVIVAGDLNTFQWTNDLAEILPGDDILEPLRNHDDNTYTFIFEGNSQVLDHMFATQNLAAQAKFDIVHVNVDFPRRFSDVVGSDHEPIIGWFKVGTGS